MQFDDDIQEDLDNLNTFALACVAQDLRNTIKHVAPRNLIAALRRKQAEEKKTDG